MFDICLLGTGGMMPTPDRFLTALLCRFQGGMILVDCGEGTQVTLKLLGWGVKHIDAICFTHYHADHISGLPGMLLTIGNAGRTEPLQLVGPPGLQEVVSGLRKIAPELPYSIVFREFSASQESFQVGEVLITALAVEHLVTCYAYRLEIKRIGKFDPQKAEALSIPKKYWSVLQKQVSIVLDGEQVVPEQVLGEQREGLSICYCTDSRPTNALVGLAEKVDLFVCEGMYGEDEKRKMAVEKKHMLFSEAAELAKQSEAKELWLTHFSPSLREPQDFLTVATNIFPHTKLGEDRMIKILQYANYE